MPHPSDFSPMSPTPLEHLVQTAPEWLKRFDVAPAIESLTRQPLEHAIQRIGNQLRGVRRRGVLRGCERVDAARSHDDLVARELAHAHHIDPYWPHQQESVEHGFRVLEMRNVEPLPAWSATREDKR